MYMAPGKYSIYNICYIRIYKCLRVLYNCLFADYLSCKNEVTLLVNAA